MHWHQVNKAVVALEGIQALLDMFDGPIEGPWSAVRHGLLVAREWCKNIQQKRLVYGPMVALWLVKGLKFATVERSNQQGDKWTEVCQVVESWWLSSNATYYLEVHPMDIH